MTPKSLPAALPLVSGRHRPGLGRTARPATGQDVGVGPSDDRASADRRTRAANATRAVGRGARRAAVGTARATSRTGRRAAGRVHAYTHAGGAGASGLARLTELHA